MQNKNDFSLEKICGKRIVLFGAGNGLLYWFRNLKDWFSFDNIAYICDRDMLKWGLKINGFEVTSPSQLLKEKTRFKLSCKWN